MDNIYIQTDYDKDAEVKDNSIVCEREKNVCCIYCV